MIGWMEEEKKNDISFPTQNTKLEKSIFFRFVEFPEINRIRWNFKKLCQENDIFCSEYWF